MLGIINTSNQNQINQFIAENSLTFPIIYDPGSSGGVQGGDTYDLYYMPNDGSPYPRDFIIDQEGIIRYANNEIDTQWMLSVLYDLLDYEDILIGDVNEDQIINILAVSAPLKWCENNVNSRFPSYIATSVPGRQNRRF